MDAFGVADRSGSRPRCGDWTWSPRRRWSRGELGKTGEHLAAGDSRYSAGRRDADRDERHVGQSPTRYDYFWRRCNASGNSCSNIGPARSTAYTLRQNDVGHTIRLRVRATNSDGSTYASSGQTALITAAPPAAAEHGPADDQGHTASRPDAQG